MKSLLRFFAIAFSVALVSASCEKKPLEPQGDLKAPHPVVTDRTATSFVISWEEVQDADRYVYVFNGGEEGVTDENSISFENMEGGKYTFKVKAASSTGRFNDSGWAEISFGLNTITLSFEIADLTPVSARVVATPSEDDVWYYFNLYPAERFSGTDAEILAAIKADLQSQCDEVGISLKEGMEQIRNMGVDEWKAGSMMPDHDYAVYGYILDDDGNETSFLFTEKFRTPSAPADIIQFWEVNHTDYIFSINTGEYDHVFVPVKKGVFEMGGFSEMEYLQQFGVKSKGNRTYHWVHGEELVPGYVMEVSPNTEYFILAAICNEDRTSYGPVERIDFKTPAKATMDDTADVDITDITSDSAKASIKTVDSVVEYIVFWKEKSWHDMVMDNYGEGVLMSTVKASVEQAGGLKLSGAQAVDVTGLKPATEYVFYLVAFGSDGSETMLVTPFTTLQ